VAQVEHLPSKCEALSSNHSTTKKKKKKRQNFSQAVKGLKFTLQLFRDQGEVLPKDLKTAQKQAKRNLARAI
jgi:hypothetical protein